MAIAQVQTINGVKTVVPLSGSTPSNEVALNNMHSVTSNAVAKSLSYSETEQLTGGKWIDGKPIYRKVVDIGYLPNTSIKYVQHNISNIDKVLSISGVVKRDSDDLTYNIPSMWSTSGVTYFVILYANKTQISIRTTGNRNEFGGYAILEYTKSS